jgi:hypothetical protein
MNSKFPPIRLRNPEVKDRKKSKGNPIPLPDDVVAHRLAKSERLLERIDALSMALSNLSEDKRKAVFYRLESEGVIDKKTITGTGLIVVSQPSPDCVYVVPMESDLTKLEEKVRQYGSGKLKQANLPPNPWVAKAVEFDQADPRERLSIDLQADYDLICKSKDQKPYEVVFRSLIGTAKKQRKELDEWCKDLELMFSSVHGTLFESDYELPTCRVVLRCNGAMLRKMVEESIWISRIRSIEPRPRFQTFQDIKDSFNFGNLEPIPSPGPNAPTVCIVDSGVTTGNPFLAPVNRIGYSKSFLESDPGDASDGFGHGSAVASLAAYGQLALAKNSVNIPKVWIANARILNAQNELDDAQLFGPLLERVVKHFAPLGVRVFCLAVADSNRVWGRKAKLRFASKSWVARRIDKLSREFDVVFVTCTGNLFPVDVREHYREGFPYPNNLVLGDSRILDPGQAALAITVGAVAGSTLVTSPKGQNAIALRNQPSPFTRSGPGIGNEIKPELVEHGGNWTMDTTGTVVRPNLGLSIPCASNKLTPAVVYMDGTSFAAPKVAHQLALIQSDLTNLGIRPSSSLMRAFLVNSAVVFQEENEVDALVEDSSLSKDELQLLIGYGRASAAKATSSDEYEVVTYFDGEIEPNKVLYFDIVVPEELVASASRKRLSVTLAFAPEVQKWGLERYLGAEIKWKIFRGDISRDSIRNALSAPDDESDEVTQDEEEELEHDQNSPGELPFTPGFTRRSKGTVQHATYEWKSHREHYSAGHYTLAVVAYKRWERKVKNVPLAIVVRLEETGRAIEIYSRVRTKIEVEVRT